MSCNTFLNNFHTTNCVSWCWRHNTCTKCFRNDQTNVVSVNSVWYWDRRKLAFGWVQWSWYVLNILQEPYLDRQVSHRQRQGAALKVSLFGVKTAAWNIEESHLQYQRPSGNLQSFPLQVLWRQTLKSNAANCLKISQKGIGPCQGSFQRKNPLKWHIW